MPIKQIHLQICKSTQSEIKNDIHKEHHLAEHFIVSCDKQLNGHGRNEKIWQHFKRSLAFSFRLIPSDPITLTSLEIAILIKEFLEKKYQIHNEIKLKWPNDIYYKNKKISGILIDLIIYNNQQIAFVGAGINFTQNRYFSHIEKKLLLKDLQIIPMEIYQYILNNRLYAEQIIMKFKRSCIHLNCSVSINDENGTFIDLTPFGEAILKTKNGEIKKFISGHLKMLSFDHVC